MKVKKLHIYTTLPFFVFMLVLLLVVLVFLLFRQIPPNVLGVTETISSGKEMYVPFGTGANTSTDWMDVKGAAAHIDSRLYGKVKKATFEASISVPSGNQTTSIRLFNATDKHPVWYSEMTLSGAGPELLISQPIALDAGNKLYQVQAKSQLGALTNILQARMHVITY